VAVAALVVVVVMAVAVVAAVAEDLDNYEHKSFGRRDIDRGRINRRRDYGGVAFLE
jgi:hypothetical protein